MNQATPRHGADADDVEVAPRRSAVSPPEPTVARSVARRSAEPDTMPADSSPVALPRRSLESPAESPQIASTPQPLRHGGTSRWISVALAPLVVLASAGIGVLAGIEAGSFAQPPEPYTPTMTPSASPTLTLSEPTEASGIPIQLDDTRFEAPEPWVISAENTVANNRTEVRLLHPATGARLQAVTLGEQDGDLETSCSALVDLQQQAYTNVTRHLTLRIESGVTCGFEGIRQSDERGNVVSITLLQRPDDAHLLLLRSTIPDDVDSREDARAQLVGMQCEASRNFGVPKPLC